MKQPKQPNKEYINQSLLNQITDYAGRLAERESVITEQYQKIKELEKELEELRQEQIKEMDKEGNKKNEKTS